MQGLINGQLIGGIRKNITVIAPNTPVLSSITLSADPNPVVQTTGLTGSTITATALDQNNNPMSGITVYLTASNSGNLLSPVTTGSNGQATATLTLPMSVANSLTVNVQAHSGNINSRTLPIFFNSAPAQTVNLNVIYQGLTYTVSFVVPSLIYQTVSSSAQGAAFEYNLDGSALAKLLYINNYIHRHRLH